jgi:diguanylate cyclase (GGDEF)-like protein
MFRLPGHLWLVGLAAIVLLIAATAVPNAAPVSPRDIIGAASELTYSTQVNPRVLAGIGALVVAGMLLLLFFYRRRLYILFWVAGWLVTSSSMFAASRQFDNVKASWLAYGVAQFLGIVSTLFFVIGADAYRTRPRLQRGYAIILLPILLWFALAPLALGPSAVFAPGHLLIAGGLVAAAVGHFMLVGQPRMVGAAVVAVGLLAIAGSNAWIAITIPGPSATESARALYIQLSLYLVTALGMQLMTFEDMTYELRRTNRRLETAQGKLRRMVITDPLTGCRNRRFFDEIIGRELQRHQRHGIPMSLVFVDVNQFKAINDTLGHDIGDRVLQQVAAFLLSRTREADYVFRWGGDEFLILMSCSEIEARRRAMALQAEFTASPENAALPAGVGLSVGCAEVKDDSDDVMALIKIADERMYENKRAIRKKGTERKVVAMR